MNHVLSIFIHQAVELQLSQNSQYPAITEQCDIQTEIEELHVIFKELR